MTGNPSVVFCTTCKGRAQHVEQTLPINLSDNSPCNGYGVSKFVILDYNSQDGLIEYLKRFQRWIDEGRLVVYSYREDVPFRMAHAKNMAHRLGMLEGAEILVNLDADNYTGPGFGSYVAAEFKKHGDNAFLWAKMVKGEMPRGINGRIAVTVSAFLKSGGYDEEQFNTWSPDDKDFNCRLRRLGYDGVEIDPRFLNAVRHNDKMRFREYPYVKCNDYEDARFASVAHADTTIANYGKIGLGTVYRNFDFSNSVELKPLPTRIFGVGLHKTATTSLHDALSHLGFDSAHWTSAHWAKSIWEEMVAAGRSKTLERHYALCDLPMPLLFRELDRAYPGSKFILTARDEGKWLESVRRHWSHEHNRFRAGWSRDPFTHRVHKLLYGQKGFDAELFLNRYRRHNDEVFRYFYDRGDFLYMNPDNGDGWTELCRFLERPVPDVPYPHRYASPREPL